jgi:uncharacterized delta-60 repeat protein
MGTAMIGERTHLPGAGKLATLYAMVLAACLCACGTDSGDGQPAGAPGAIDTAFGEGGIRRLSYPASADDVRIDSQGRVLVASHYRPLNEALFTRVLTDGGFDPSLFQRMPATLGGPYGSAVFPFADGRFIGTLKGSPVIPGPAGVGHVAASRFDAGGVPDPTYGSGGTAIFQTRSIHDVVGGADGSVVVLGMMTPIASPTGAAQVARLDPAGQPVAAYERLAEGAIGACGNSVAYGYRGAFQPDARLVVAIAPSPNLWCVARLNADGSADTGFGNGGRLPISPPPAIGESSTPTQVLIRPDGSIVALFAFRAGAVGSSNRTAILWLTKDGQVDASRGTAGVSLVEESLLGESLHAATQADGKLLLVGYPLQATAGSSIPAPDSTRPRIVRLDADGRPDTAFGPSGNGIVLLEAGGNRLLPTRVVATGVGTTYVAGGAVPVGPGNDLAYLSLSVMKLFTGER